MILKSLEAGYFMKIKSLFLFIFSFCLFIGCPEIASAELKNPKKISHYDTDGNLIFIEKKEYNKKGDLKKSVVEKNGKITTISLYLYTDDKEENIPEWNDELTVYVLKHDEHKNIVEWIDNDKLCFIYKYDYDEKGRLIKKQSLDKETKEPYFLETYEYNVKGQIEMEKSFSSYSGRLNNYIENEYDEKGNLIKSKYIIPAYFDEKEDSISVTEYIRDKKGTVIEIKENGETRTKIDVVYKGKTIKKTIEMLKDNTKSIVVYEY